MIYNTSESRPLEITTECNVWGKRLQIGDVRVLHISVGGRGGSADCCKKQSPPNVQYSAQLLPETKLNICWSRIYVEAECWEAFSMQYSLHCWIRRWSSVMLEPQIISYLSILRPLWIIFKKQSMAFKDELSSWLVPGWNTKSASTWVSLQEVHVKDHFRIAQSLFKTSWQ